MKISLKDNHQYSVNITVDLDDVKLSDHKLAECLSLSQDQISFIKRHALDVDKIPGCLSSLYFPNLCIRIQDCVPRTAVSLKTQSRPWYVLKKDIEDDFRAMIGDMNANIDSVVTKPLGVGISFVRLFKMNDVIDEVVSVHRDMTGRKNLLRYTWLSYEAYGMTKRAEMLQKQDVPYEINNEKLRYSLLGLTVF